MSLSLLLMKTTFHFFTSHSKQFILGTFKPTTKMLAYWIIKAIVILNFGTYKSIKIMIYNKYL